MQRGSWEQMQSEISRQVEARLDELRRQGVTLYDQQIHPDDVVTSGRPELWSLVKTDTDEVVLDRVSDAEVEAYLAHREDWVAYFAVWDEIQDDVREDWEVT